MDGDEEKTKRGRYKKYIKDPNLTVPRSTKFYQQKRQSRSDHEKSKEVCYLFKIFVPTYERSH